MRIVVWLMVFVCPLGVSAAETLRTDYLHSSLVSAQADVTPGQPLLLGLLLEHDPGWHTYWENPGDSGLPTRLRVQIGQGEEHEVRPLWPLPARIPLDERLVNFGYKERELLPFLVSVPHSASMPLEITVRASWLVCQEACIPGRGEYRLTLPLDQAALSSQTDFERAARRQPRQLPAGSDYRVENGEVRLRMPRQAFPGHPGQWVFFPLTTELVRNSEEPRWQRRGRYWEATLPRSEFFTAAPEQAEWLLVRGDEGIRVVAAMRSAQ